MDDKLAELWRGSHIAAGEGGGSESIPEPTPSALTPVAVQLRTVGVKRAMPRMLDISHKLTVAFRGRPAELNAPAKPVLAADPDAVLIRNNRRVRAARPQSS